jgi:hypothetical protein
MEPSRIMSREGLSLVGSLLNLYKTRNVPYLVLNQFQTSQLGGPLYCINGWLPDPC